jgi:hypothetical protein
VYSPIPSCQRDVPISREIKGAAQCPRRASIEIPISVLLAGYRSGAVGARLFIASALAELADVAFDPHIVRRVRLIKRVL